MANPAVDTAYLQWKSVVPTLYDWFTDHNVSWPSLSCRWGPQGSKARQKNIQRLYFSEQTDDSVPNTLVAANIAVVKARVAAADHMSQFDEEARSPFITLHKTILHPGEVNRIRELPQNSNVVATHTDSPDVLIWDFGSQSNRISVSGAKPSCPDLILTGHQDIAEYALAMCSAESFVLSGGQDKFVVLWSIHDHISSLALRRAAQQSSAYKGGAVSRRAADASTVQARGIFQGHTNTVEDCTFNPSSAQEFCSVGDDSCLILWDARTGSSPAIKVEKAHNDDIHCVDWNPTNVNLILTGSADRTIRLYDRRNLTCGGAGSPIHIFHGHGASVNCVQWCPDKASVFGSAADDSFLNIWNLEKIGKLDGSSGTGNSSNPPGLFFKHAGHREKVVDFHWNPHEPWTIVSASADTEKAGGGKLQVWRMLDLLYREEDEVIAELDRLKSHVCRMLDLLYREEDEVVAELDRLKSHVKTCSSSS